MNRLFISKRPIIKCNFKLITSIDKHFNSLIMTDGISLSDMDLKFMKKVDHAVLSQNVGFINTPFGVTSIINLSTGTKTLILANHSLENEVLDISQCGYNVIDILFNYMDNKRYYLSFCIVPKSLKIPVRVNNREKICNNIYELTDSWEV